MTPDMASLLTAVIFLLITIGLITWTIHEERRMREPLPDGTWMIAGEEE